MGARHDLLHVVQVSSTKHCSCYFHTQAPLNFFWHRRFASTAGSWQTLFELSNWYGTEHVYVQRKADSLDITLGVSHTSGSFKKEFSTSSGSAINANGKWQHLCWSIQHILPQNMSQSLNQTGMFMLLPESLFWSSLPTSYSTATSYVAVQALASYQVFFIVNSMCIRLCTCLVLTTLRVHDVCRPSGQFASTEVMVDPTSCMKT
jgi:hypothetical protein